MLYNDIVLSWVVFIKLSSVLSSSKLNEWNIIEVTERLFLNIWFQCLTLINKSTDMLLDNVEYTREMKYVVCYGICTQLYLKWTSLVRVFDHPHVKGVCKTGKLYLHVSVGNDLVVHDVICSIVTSHVHITARPCKVVGCYAELISIWLNIHCQKVRLNLGFKSMLQRTKLVMNCRIW